MAEWYENKTDIEAQGQKEESQSDFMTGVFADNIISLTSKKAETIYNQYSQIEVIRPYFDTTPMEVLSRLVLSLDPRLTSSNKTIHPDLYGPVMLSFTLVAILIINMKSSEKFSDEGALMGSALGIVFTYWIMASLLFWFFGFLVDSSNTLLNCFSLVGYGFTGYVLVLGINFIGFRNYYVFGWELFFGILCCLALGSRFYVTVSHSKGLILGFAAGLIHFAFLLYIRYAYASLVEVIEKNLVL